MSSALAEEVGEGQTTLLHKAIQQLPWRTTFTLTLDPQPGPYPRPQLLNCASGHPILCLSCWASSWSLVKVQ